MQGGVECMKNIDTVLTDFLEEQNNRLKPRTYRDYDEVISLFKDYLNSYAYQYLDDDDDLTKWEAHHEEDRSCFTELFGPDKLDTTTNSEFLDYFVIDKVMGSEEFLKQSLRVMKKLSKWLQVNGYTTDDDREYFNESKDLPNVERLSKLIYKHVQHSHDKNCDDVLQGHFSINEVEDGVLWLNEVLGEKVNIGPVLVTKQISDLAKIDWNIHLTIGRDKDAWHILESGNVYR